MFVLWPLEGTDKVHVVICAEIIYDEKLTDKKSEMSGCGPVINTEAEKGRERPCVKLYFLVETESCFHEPCNVLL